MSNLAKLFVGLVAFSQLVQFGATSPIDLAKRNTSPRQVFPPAFCSSSSIASCHKTLKTLPLASAVCSIVLGYTTSTVTVSTTSTKTTGTATSTSLTTTTTSVSTTTTTTVPSLSTLTTTTATSVRITTVRTIDATTTTFIVSQPPPLVKRGYPFDKNGKAFGYAASIVSSACSCLITSPTPVTSTIRGQSNVAASTKTTSTVISTTVVTTVIQTSTSTSVTTVAVGTTTTTTTTIDVTSTTTSICATPTFAIRVAQNPQLFVSANGQGGTFINNGADAPYFYLNAAGNLFDLATNTVGTEAFDDSSDVLLDDLAAEQGFGDTRFTCSIVTNQLSCRIADRTEFVTCGGYLFLTTPDNRPSSNCEVVNLRATNLYC